MCGPSTSNSRGTTSTWTSSSFSARIELERARAVLVCENATITRSTSSASTMRGRSLDRAEDRQVAEALAALARMVVDEADHVDAVLGVLQQLARDPLADVAGADDRPCSGRTQSVRRQIARAAVRRDDDERHGEQPEQQRASGSSGSRSPGHVARREQQPRADGEHVEDARRSRRPCCGSARSSSLVRARRAGRARSTAAARAAKIRISSVPAQVVVDATADARTRAASARRRRRDPTTSAAASARRMTQPRGCPWPRAACSSSARVRSSSVCLERPARRRAHLEPRGQQPRGRRCSSAIVAVLDVLGSAGAGAAVFLARASLAARVEPVRRVPLAQRIADGTYSPSRRCARR